MRNLHRLERLLVGVLVCCAVAAARAELVMEVIPLKYRNVEQILPVIQPLVPQPGTVSGLSGSLIVRTTPANLAEVKRMLAALDRVPRRLLISVRQDADRNEAGTAVGGAGSWGTRERRAQQQDNAAGRVSVGVLGTQSLSNDRHTQQVEATEGNEATISVGYSVPVTTRHAVRDTIGGRVVERWVDTVEYRDILSGFTVRPQLAGDIVTLQVNPQHDTPGGYGRGSMNVQRIGTTVTGRLGEWIELGAVVRGRALESDSATYRTSVASGDNRRILIRVDALD